MEEWCERDLKLYLPESLAIEIVMPVTNAYS